MAQLLVIYWNEICRLGNLRRFRRLCELIQVQVCSRRPPPASPRASRKFASSELRDSESGGSDISDKSSLLASDGGSTSERRVGCSSVASRGKTCAKKPAGATAASTTTPLSNVVVVGSRRPSPKSPSNPLANPILEEVLETQTNNQDTSVEVSSSSPAKLEKSSLLVHDDNLEKMNVQNGLSPEQRENGNPPTSIVPNETEVVETNKSPSPPQDNNATKVVVANKIKGKSTRGDSTDALLSDEDKSPNDENNSTIEWDDRKSKQNAAITHSNSITLLPRSNATAKKRNEIPTKEETEASHLIDHDCERHSTTFVQYFAVPYLTARARGENHSSFSFLYYSFRSVSFLFSFHYVPGLLKLSLTNCVSAGGRGVEQLLLWQWTDKAKRRHTLAYQKTTKQKNTPWSTSAVELGVITQLSFLLNLQCFYWLWISCIFPI